MYTYFGGRGCLLITVAAFSGVVNLCDGVLKSTIILSSRQKQYIYKCWPIVYAAALTVNQHRFNIPANKRHSTNTGLMLAHRLRRLISIKPALVQCPVYWDCRIFTHLLQLLFLLKSHVLLFPLRE